MILLEVKKYCHTCPCFEAETMDASTLSESNFLVFCKHNGECENIARHLKEELKE